MSASVYRAIMPSSTDFPTPEPAMMPIRCPRPQVRQELIDLIPTSSGCLIRLRFMGLITSGYNGISVDVSSSPFPSRGRINGSKTLPSKPSPTGTIAGRSSGTTRHLGPIPCALCKGITSILSWRNPTTSAATVLRNSGLYIRHIPPTAQPGFVASTMLPITCITRPSLRTAGKFSISLM